MKRRVGTYVVKDLLMSALIESLAGALHLEKLLVGPTLMA
jgi:hypothetical protein